jgi:hypothetical protein
LWFPETENYLGKELFRIGGDVLDREIVLKGNTEVSSSVGDFSAGLSTHLASLGLPSSQVLVPIEERIRVFNNLPEVINIIDDEKKSSANYLSKFIAACGAGLFDAALNFMWDETVINLRLKVSRFDLEYFYDSVITDPNRRKKLKGDEDLTKIDDWELITGCHLTGILSDIGFKHLDYIRDMRNWASAAHPNQNEITGLQLVSWLETCLKEVIAKEPVGHVVEIRRCLNSVRSTVLTERDANYICAGIENLPNDLSTSLLRTLFGMYTSEKASVQVKSNIKHIANTVWGVANEEVRYECGMKYSIYASNGEIERRNAADEFLRTVGGLPYLPKDTLALEMSERISNLYKVHTSFYNFYNEPAHAKALQEYVSSAGTIPDAVRKPYVKTLVMAKIGNGYGVANMAVEYYDNMIEKFGEKEFREVARLLFDREFASRIALRQCSVNYKSLVNNLKERTTDHITMQAFDRIIDASEAQLENLGNETALISIFKNSQR